MGVPIDGFPTLRDDVAVLENTTHEGTGALRDAILQEAKGDGS